MKIVLRAFGNKLSGVMEIPEETGTRFRLAMTQPISMKMIDMRDGYPMMDKPIETICEWEWTGKIFMQDGHEWNNAKEYQLISIEKF